MNLHHELTNIQRLAGHLAGRVPDAAARCKDNAHGAYLASPSLEGTRSPGTHSDPTAQRAQTTPADPHVRDLRALPEVLHTIRQGLDWLDGFANRHPAPRPGTPEDRAADQPHCASCARIGEWQAPQVLAPRIETVPNLPLCRWCADYTRAELTWPPLTMLEEKHRTGRVRIHTN